LKIAIREVDGISVLKIAGRLTLEEVTILEDQTRELLAAGRNRIVLNLLDVRDLSSSGIGGILSIKKALEAKGGALALSQLSAVAEYVLDLSRLKDIFPSFPSDETAIQGIKPS